MDGAVIWNERNGKILQEFKTLRGANGSFKRTGRDQNSDLVCSTKDYYLKTGHIKAMSLVTVINLLTKKPVQIPLVDVGTNMDPSTEGYHCI